MKSPKSKSTHSEIGIALAVDSVAIFAACIAILFALSTLGCAPSGQSASEDGGEPSEIGSETSLDASEPALTDEELKALEAQRAAQQAATQEATAQAEAERKAQAAAEAQRLRAQGASAIYSTMRISEDMRPSFVHGNKTAEHQKYIVLHDTEGNGSASSVIDWWDSNGQLVAAHFVVNKDGSIVQCAPLDAIVHHAGFGDTGHNALYGVTDESRDDKRGTTPIGSWAADYGMNSYSVGIEMVHVGGSGPYPEAQLAALDSLIAYIDAYYGFESKIIDHKAWRSGNSDTSAEFAPYLRSYQSQRTHA